LEAHCLVARLAGVDITEPQHSNKGVNDSNVNSSFVSSSSSNKNIELKYSSDANPIFPSFQPKVSFPFLALLVSGGHTSLVICRGMGNYSVIGGTLDDSLGR